MKKRPVRSESPLMNDRRDRSLANSVPNTSLKSIHVPISQAAASKTNKPRRVVRLSREKCRWSKPLQGSGVTNRFFIHPFPYLCFFYLNFRTGARNIFFLFIIVFGNRIVAITYFTIDADDQHRCQYAQVPINRERRKRETLGEKKELEFERTYKVSYTTFI